MADRETGRGRVAAAFATLMERRWTTLAGIVAVLAIAMIENASLGPVLVLALAIVAVAMFAPPRAPIGRGGTAGAATRPSGIQGLSAARLAAAVPDPLILFDASGEIIHANAAAEVTFGGLRPGVVLALKFRTPEMRELIEQVTAGHAPPPIDYAERVPIERLHKVSAAPVGEDTGIFVMVFKDQSEVRRIDRMRADFIANASHELRTPLASISGFIETLRGPARNDARARENFLKIMEDQTARMARLIDDLLSLSRLEMKPFARPGGKADLRAVVDGVADSLSHLAGELGVEIARQYPAEVFEVPGSPDELIQVFENLLENALKYGHAGGRVEIDIEREATERGPEEIAVTIRDFGPGIAEEHIPRITERFYRVDVESSRAQKGTGLGLSIVKHILTRHNGRLSINSRPGEGAAFTVHLPAAA